MKMSTSLSYETFEVYSSNYNRASDVAVRVCVALNMTFIRFLERLMSPSPKSQVMVAFS